GAAPALRGRSRAIASRCGCRSRRARAPSGCGERSARKRAHASVESVTLAHRLRPFHAAPGAGRKGAADAPARDVSGTKAARGGSSDRGPIRRHARTARAAAQQTALAVLLLASLIAPRAARALDTDIFTGTGVNPNVIIIFDNSGSMGSQAYNTYPNTIYSGSFDQGTIYSRCKNKNGIAGGDVNSNCTCRNTQSSWVVDQSACADTFEDLIPPPAGDDTDDRESRRKYGNRLDFETNAPKNCIQSPFQACTSNTQCTGMGNQCAAQNKLAVAKGVVTSLINDPDNAKLRLGLVIFNPTGIDYSNANYGSTSWVTSWQVNNGVYKFAAQD